MNSTAQPAGKPLPAYVNSVPQLEARMRALATKFPDLVQLQDIGDSADKVDAKPGGGHDIFGLTIGRATGADGAPTPTVAHIAGLHPSEWANPHLLLEWAERATAGYGTDPEATRLLNQARVAMVPLANPDSYAQAIGQDGFQRHNSRRVDLNRNFPGSWEAGDTHGPAAGSEPETQAVAGFLRAVKPTAMIDWHSFISANIYNDEDGNGSNRAMADRIGEINGYRPLPGRDLYPAPGSGNDFGSLELGIPAITIETGKSYAQRGQEYRETLARNLPVIDFTAAIAADPRTMLTTPMLDKIVVDAQRGYVQARASYPDGWMAFPRMNRVEFVLDPAAAPGTGIALTKQSHDGGLATYRGALPSGALDGAQQGVAWLRVTSDSPNEWGPLQPVKLP